MKTESSAAAKRYKEKMLEAMYEIYRQAAAELNKEDFDDLVSSTAMASQTNDFMNSLSSSPYPLIEAMDKTISKWKEDTACKA